MLTTKSYTQLNKLELDKDKLKQKIQFGVQVIQWQQHKKKGY